MARIYVGTYAKYNNGDLTGEWLDPEEHADKDAFLAACRELHKDEADPELMFQDHEDCGGFVSESSIDEELWEWLELEDDERTMLELYREDIDGSGTIEQAREAYCGQYDSEEDYAEELFNDIHQIPDFLQGYIDWERVARDLRLGGDNTFVRHEGKTYVFRNI